MKKKLLGILFLGFMIISMTGCVKFNVEMDVKKDKSMDFSIIYALDSSYLPDQEFLTEEDKKKVEEKGFSIKDYKDGNMTGYKISKKVKNIDDISSSENIEYSLSGLLGEEDSKYIFKVKKGFLKNTYYANFKFDASDSDLNDNMSSPDDKGDDFNWNDEMDSMENEDDNYDWNLDDSEDGDSNSDNALGDMSQFEGMISSSMDLKFHVVLPYGAKKNNATKVSSNGKELTWSLTTTGVENLEFEFELYNMTAVLICGGVCLGIIVIVILIIIIALKKKKGKKTSSGNLGQSKKMDEMPIPNVVPNQNSVPVQNPNAMPNQNNVPVQNPNVVPTQNSVPVQNPNAMPNQNNVPVQNPNVVPNQNNVPVQNPNVMPNQNNVSVPNPNNSENL